jgi:light-regulated signal transduction histidine kinase (bacteriophytochrome)
MSGATRHRDVGLRRRDRGLLAALGLGALVAWSRGRRARAERHRALGEARLARARATVAERTLATHARELERSNRDLEQFAYVASHDLSEPLRTVSGFVRLLETRYKGRLDEDADEFIHFAVDGVRRMQRLIDDLLQFSRVGRAEAGPDAVDLTTLVPEVLDGLRDAIDRSAADVQVDALPVVLGDGPQLAQLFQNLISNALKFTDGHPPHVRITAEPSAERWQLAVVDDGIGIDPSAAGRVFQTFQRLHSAEAYDGTGIGLAICERIVERHGGRIWVEPGPGGVGSAFRFTLPRAPAAVELPGGRLVDHAEGVLDT